MGLREITHLEMVWLPNPSKISTTIRRTTTWKPSPSRHYWGLRDPVHHGNMAPRSLGGPPLCRAALSWMYRYPHHHIHHPIFLFFISKHFQPKLLVRRVLISDKCLDFCTEKKIYSITWRLNIHQCIIWIMHWNCHILYTWL